MCMESQGKNSKGKLTTLDDFGLKCCIEGQKSKNKRKLSSERGMRITRTNPGLERFWESTITVEIINSS